MNFLQRLVVWLAARLSPSLARLLRTTGTALDRAELEIRELRTKNNARRQRIQEEKDELLEALEMIGPSWSASGVKVSARTAESLREAGAPAGVVKCYERLWELELALEDRGWVRELALSNFEFSLFGIHRIIALCRLYQIKNPLIRRGIQVSAFYPFGRGFTVTSKDEDANAVLQAFFTNPKNIAEVGHRALVKREEQIWTDGNIYWIFFRDDQNGDLLIRTIDPIEVVEIISDPNDASSERFIHRRWLSQTFDTASGVHLPKPAEAWYPALGYTPTGADRPEKINGVVVSWATPVMHVKEGGNPKWQFGVPLAYPAIDYARATRKLIDNWCSIQEAMSRFAWQVETEGGLPAIANLKTALATTLAIGDGSTYEQNPPPTTAASWISGPGVKLAMSKTSGMIDGPEVGRRVAHLVYMVFGLPETFFADVSVGTLATATSLDHTTEVMFTEVQERWREWLQRISTEVLDSSATAPLGRLREAQRRGTKPASPSPTVEVVFPSIMEQDLTEQVSAIATAITLNGYGEGIDERTGVGLLLQELQVENWMELLEMMYPQAEYKKVIDRTPQLVKSQEMALNAPDPSTLPAAAPGVMPPAKPGAKPAPRRASPEEAAKLERACKALDEAARLMKARGGWV